MFTLRSRKPLPWLLAATLLLASGLAAALPVQTDGPTLTCLPLDGHLGQFGCELPLGLRDSPPHVAEPQPQPGSGPEAAPAPGTEPDEREPAGGLVVLASVAAVLSLSLRRAAA